MRKLTSEEMKHTRGGEDDNMGLGRGCGAAIGITFGAGLLFGVVGVALTAPKAFAVCVMDAGGVF